MSMINAGDQWKKELDTLSRRSAFNAGMALGFQRFVAAILKDDKLTVNQIYHQIKARLNEIEESRIEMERIQTDNAQKELRFYAE